MASRNYKRGLAFPHEGFVQLSIEQHFLSKGFELAPDGRVDLQCANPVTGEKWHIEAKGVTTAVGLDFRTGVGQLVQAMASPSVKYALAMPETLQFRRQVGQFSVWAVSRLCIYWLFVKESGVVEIVEPPGACSAKNIKASAQNPCGALSNDPIVMR